MPSAERALGFDRERYRAAAIPNAPVPSSINVPGSGTGEGEKTYSSWKSVPGSSIGVCVAGNPPAGGNPKNAALAVPVPISVVVNTGMSSGPGLNDAHAVRKPLNVNGTVTVCAPSPLSTTEGVTNVPPLVPPPKTS